MSEEVNRRRYVKYAGAGVVVIAVAGAGAYYATRPAPPVTPTETTTEKPTETTTEKPTETTTEKPTEIQVLFPNTQLDYFEAMTPRFEQDVPEVKVKLSGVAFDEIYTLVPTSMSAGSDEYDLIVYPDSQLPMGFEAGWFEPLENYINGPHKINPDFDIDNFLEHQVHEMVTHRDGKIYALPLTYDCTMMYYNKNLLKENGFTDSTGEAIVPETWDKTFEIIETVHDPDKGIYGAGIGGAWIKWDYVAWAYSYGATGIMTDPDTFKPVFDQPAALEALENLVWTWDYTQPDAISHVMFDMNEYFKAGKIAIGWGWTAIGYVMEDETQSEVAGQVGYLPYPQRHVVYGSGWGTMINKNSKNKDATWKFMEWLTREENMLEQVEYGHMGPTLTKIFEDEEYLRKNPVSKALSDSIKYVKFAPRLPVQGEVYDTIQPYIHKALLKEMTPKQAVDAMQKDTLPLLEPYMK